MKYNRLVLLGNCQTGRNIFKKLFINNYNEIIFDNSIAYLNEVTHDFVKFISAPIPKGKILSSFCSNCKVLNKLENYSFNNWKFILINRDLKSTIPSNILNDFSFDPNWINDFHENLRIVGHFEYQLKLFYPKIKDKCITFNFSDVYYHTIEVVKKTFNFLELPVPKDSVIKQYASEEFTLKFIRDNKIKLGEEFNLLDKIQQKEIIDYIENGYAFKEKK